MMAVLEAGKRMPESRKRTFDETPPDSSPEIGRDSGKRPQEGTSRGQGGPLAPCGQGPQRVATPGRGFVEGAIGSDRGPGVAHPAFFRAVRRAA